MTYDEAIICFNYHYPVTCLRKIKDLEFMYGRYYYLSGVNLSNDIHDSKVVNESAVVEMNRKSVGTVDIKDIKPAAGFERLVADQVKEQHVKDFNKHVYRLVDNGSTQTQIVDYVKKIIRRKKEQK